MEKSMTSALIKNQKKVFGWKEYQEKGTTYRIKTVVRYDDECGNGHNTFSITANIDVKRGNQYGEDSGGCLHDEIAKHFPELAHLIQWHLVSTDGPLHYVANTVYHAEQGKLDYARSTAIWPDASIEQLKDKQALLDRLPALMEEFKNVVEELGFNY